LTKYDYPNDKLAQNMAKDKRSQKLFTAAAQAVAEIRLHPKRGSPMMRWKIALLTAALLFLWSIGSLFAAGVTGEDAQKELKKFEGTWVMVSGEQGGKKVADEHVSRSKIIFTGDKGQIIVPNQTAETIVFDIVKIDLTKNPKQMHFVRRNGPFAGKTVMAIYEFAGNDQYHFAFDPTCAGSVKEFTPKEGAGHIHNTWKRIKP
jgi:uncharacterized protein (TIGR03067 family)